MASLPPTAFNNTYRVLGFSVAAGYAFLGSSVLFFPVQNATLLGLAPPETPVTRHTCNAMYWIGARDLSISAALFAFYAQGKPREMGTVILAGMILCVVDVVSVWREKRDWLGPLLATGASIWGWVGWKLVNM